MRIHSQFLLPLALLLASAAAHAQAVLTMADQPLRLIRGTVVYKAVNGVAVQRDDILETGGSGAQVEVGPNAIVALGPNTRVWFQGLVAGGKGATELALLRGWVKLQVGSSGRAQVTAPTLQVTLAGGGTVMQSQPEKDALFVEEGAQEAVKLDPNGKPGAPLKLAAEQYAAVVADKPQPVAGRPPREFISAMPPAFRDRLALAPPVPKAGKIAPVKEREAAFADVEDWLKASPQLRKGFTTRFKPRLADAAFRKQLDRTLGHTSEWKPVVNPAAAHSSLF
jgi:hypothetical protein